MSDEWGPLIAHDGATPIGRVPDGVILMVHFLVGGGGRLIPPDGTPLTPRSGNWFWRWRRVRVGWLRWERQRVCDDPAYAPIIAYQLRRTSQVAKLRRIAENPAPLPEEVPA